MTKFEAPPIDMSMFDCHQRLVPGPANDERQQTTNAALTPSATMPPAATSTDHPPATSAGHVCSHCSDVAGLKAPAPNTTCHPHSASLQVFRKY
jgi:hypothetical protein